MELTTKDTEEKIDEGNTCHEADEKRKTRKRSRHFYVGVREQMEFYFSDANLSKDRFMKQLLQENTEQRFFVPLDTFLKFNKIKKLADSTEMLAKALSNSDILEVDETKTKVRRKTPISEVTDVDDRTIYVEALPSNVDHDWMKAMFGRFGKVIYVSLPKHAQTRKPKDFGFVEFQKAKSICKAISFFKTFNGVLLKDETDPSNLASIKAHTSSDQVKPEPEKSVLKRPLTDSKDDFMVKKPKLEDVNPTTDENSSSSASESKTDNEVKEETAETKKKRRNHKKSAEKRKKQLATDAAFYELKILPKLDWKRLRNKYLNLQREKAAEFKRKAAKERQLQHAKDNNNPSSSLREAGAAVNVAKKSRNEEKLHKMKMNFYGAGDTASEPQVKSTGTKTKAISSESKHFMKFEHGLIVEIKFEKPCVEIKTFKQQMRQHKAVKYVDIKEGAMEAFLRLESAEDASNFIQCYKNVEGKCVVMSGDAEIAYWAKIERDRQMKLNKEVKIPSKRGREKVKAAIAKHILFGDEDLE